MIEFCPVLYVDPAMSCSEERVRKEILAGDFSHFAYVLAFTENCSKPEMLPTFLLKQPYYKNQKVSVFGICESKMHCEEMLTQIFDDVFTDTDDVDLRSYVFSGGE